MIVVFGPEQPEQDRQPNLPAAEAVELDDEHDHDPAVSPAGAPSGAFGLGAVVQVVRAPDLASGSAEEGVIDREEQRAVLGEHRHEEVQQPQPQLVRIPLPAGEQVVCAAVMPLARQPGGLQHPRDRAIADPADEPDQQHAERLKRWLREARRQQGQQPGKRSGNLKHGGDLPMGRAAGTLQRPAADGLLTPTGFGVAATPPLASGGS